MRIDRRIAALAILVIAGLPVSARGQQAAAQVPIVQTVGCVAVRDGDMPTWWLTSAAEPSESGVGVFNQDEVEAAMTAALGTRELQLVGVADFLDAESLLHFGDRARFTTPEQANATGQLRRGRKVLVKGLLTEADSTARVNLLAVVALADECG